jgi:hypothetical protein
MMLYIAAIVPKAAIDANGNLHEGEGVELGEQAVELLYHVIRNLCLQTTNTLVFKLQLRLIKVGGRLSDFCQ